MNRWESENKRLQNEIEKAYSDAGGHPSIAHEYANFLYGCQQNGIDIVRLSDGNITVVYNPNRKHFSHYDETRETITEKLKEGWTY